MENPQRASSFHFRQLMTASKSRAISSSVISPSPPRTENFESLTPLCTSIGCVADAVQSCLPVISKENCTRPYDEQDVSFRQKRLPILVTLRQGSQSVPVIPNGVHASYKDDWELLSNMLRAPDFGRHLEGRGYHYSWGKSSVCAPRGMPRTLTPTKIDAPM